MSKTMARLVAILLLLGASFGVRAQFCAGFVDVPDTDPFCTHITWMRNRAITLGCDATHYCPSEYVRRDQMAAFMYRLGFQNAFLNGGNTFGAEASLGTTDNWDVVLLANNAAALRLQPGGGASPNVVGGYWDNGSNPSLNGQTIGGGGRGGTNCWNPITFDFTRNCRNNVTQHFSTIGGGLANTANGTEATVAGGSSNSALNNKSTVSGGFNNVAGAVNAVVAGGEANRASATAAKVGGGTGNTAGGAHAVVAGGENNVASGQRSVVAGGFQNQAAALQGFVGGGTQNQANGVGGSTVGGGFNNVASGLDATIPGGFSNWAPADRSFAAGSRAKALNRGCFVWADTTEHDFFCGIDDAFAARAEGGFHFVTGVDNMTGAVIWGCNLMFLSGGWACASDRKLKDVHEAVDGEAVLARLAAMPMYYWSPKGIDGRVRHVGPMAQDFMAAFAVGHDNRYIGAQDADGVALAAIQGLNAKLESKISGQARELAAQASELAKRDAEIALLREGLAELRAAVEGLRAQVATGSHLAAR
jgi:hypothetical protein